MYNRLNLHEIIAMAKERRASDIHIVCGVPIRIRVDGELVDLNDDVLNEGD